jgi:hypothetical protein
MIIDKDTADARINDEDNLVNLVLNIASSRSSFIAPSVSNTPDIDIPAPDVPPNTLPDTLSNIPTGVVKPHHPGRTLGSLEVPMEFRVAAGLLANFDSVRHVGAALGLDKVTVNSARNGQTSHGQDSPELKSKLDEALGTVRDKAMDRLLSSLNLLDDEKIKKASAKDISAISANMSKVMSSTLPKDTGSVVNAQLIVYAPTQVNESHFDTVEI